MSGLDALILNKLTNLINNPVSSGGIPIGGTLLVPKSYPDLIVTKEGELLLKGGNIETDLEVYPDALTSTGIFPTGEVYSNLPYGTSHSIVRNETDSGWLFINGVAIQGEMDDDFNKVVISSAGPTKNTYYNYASANSSYLMARIDGVGNSVLRSPNSVLCTHNNTIVDVSYNEGVIYISDSSNKITKYDEITGVSLGVFTTQNQIRHGVFDGTNMVFFGANYFLYTYALDGNLLKTVDVRTGLNTPLGSLNSIAFSKKHNVFLVQSSAGIFTLDIGLNIAQHLYDAITPSLFLGSSSENQWWAYSSYGVLIYGLDNRKSAISYKEAGSFGGGVVPTEIIDIGNGLIQRNAHISTIYKLTYDLVLGESININALSFGNCTSISYLVYDEISDEILIGCGAGKASGGCVVFTHDFVFKGVRFGSFYYAPSIKRLPSGWLSGNKVYDNDKKIVLVDSIAPIPTTLSVVGGNLRLHETGKITYYTLPNKYIGMPVANNVGNLTYYIRVK